MSRRSRFLIAAALLLLVALWAGAALARGDGDPASPPTVVDDRDQREPSDSNEADGLEDADEPGDADGVGGVDDSVDEVGEGHEPSHDGDASEDEAEGPDRPITSPDLARASRVALEYLGGGHVTATEAEDEESYYEIEVTLDDGSQVDVQLDESFNVVGTD